MNSRQNQFQQGWERKKLGDVLLKTETIDPTKKPDEEFTYLDVSSVNKETKEIENATVLLGKDAPSRARKLVRTNDVIFATVRPTHSRVALITEEYDGQVCSTGYFVLRGKDFIHNQYLFYFLLTNEFNEQMEKLQKGASYPAVTDTEVKNILLCYPKSLTEQQRIVSILDEAFAAIARAKANAEQNLKNAKELFESYLQGVFKAPKNNWEVCNLESYIKLIDYRGRTPVKTESGVRLITAKNVKLGHLQLDPEEFISANNYDSWMSRGIPNLGDVIFTTEAPLANVAQINTSEKLAFAQRIIVMQPWSKKINQGFLKYMLLSNPIRGKILGKATGATVLGIKSSLLKKIEIYFPKSIEEQQSIVQKLDALSTETKKLEAIYQQKINDLEELKKSILQKAFSGELKTVEMLAV